MNRTLRYVVALSSLLAGLNTAGAQTLVDPSLAAGLGDTAQEVARLPAESGIVRDGSGDWAKHRLAKISAASAIGKEISDEVGRGLNGLESLRDKVLYAHQAYGRYTAKINELETALDGPMYFRVPADSPLQGPEGAGWSEPATVDGHLVWVRDPEVIGAQIDEYHELLPQLELLAYREGLEYLRNAFISPVVELEGWGEDGDFGRYGHISPIDIKMMHRFITELACSSKYQPVRKYKTSGFPNERYAGRFYSSGPAIEDIWNGYLEDGLSSYEREPLLTELPKLDTELSEKIRADFKREVTRRGDRYRYFSALLRGKELELDKLRRSGAEDSESDVIQLKRTISLLELTKIANEVEYLSELIDTTESKPAIHGDEELLEAFSEISGWNCAYYRERALRRAELGPQEPHRPMPYRLSFSYSEKVKPPLGPEQCAEGNLTGAIECVAETIVQSDDDPGGPEIDVSFDVVVTPYVVTDGINAVRLKVETERRPYVSRFFSPEARNGIWKDIAKIKRDLRNRRWKLRPSGSWLSTLDQDGILYLRPPSIDGLSTLKQALSDEEMIVMKPDE